MAVLAVAMAATPALAVPDAGCFETNENCDFVATYYEIGDYTSWESDCDGGYGTGSSPGNILHLIC